MRCMKRITLAESTCARDWAIEGNPSDTSCLMRSGQNPRSVPIQKRPAVVDPLADVTAFPTCRRAWCTIFWRPLRDPCQISGDSSTHDINSKQSFLTVGFCRMFAPVPCVLRCKIWRLVCDGRTMLCLGRWYSSNARVAVKDESLSSNQSWWLVVKSKWIAEFYWLADSRRYLR